MARLWLGGQMSPAPQSQVLVIPNSQVASLVASGQGGDFWRASRHPGQMFSKRNLSSQRSSVRFSDTGASWDDLSFERAGSSTLLWHTPGQDSRPSFFTFACPQTVGLTGFVGGQSTPVGPATFEVAPGARNFASLTLAAMDNKPLAQSRSMLLTAIDKAENAGLVWNPTRTAATNSWAGPVQAYGLSAKISLPLSAREVKVFALDATGARRSEIASTLEGGRLSFQIAPGDKTVWYEIAAR